MTRDLILILDFGGQYTQLIARRVRAQKVYSEIHPFNLSLARIRELAPRGIILSGGPSSSYEEWAPRISNELFQLGVPVLGKGGVTRAVKIQASVWKLVNGLRGDSAEPGDPVFRSRKKGNGGHELCREDCLLGRRCGSSQDDLAQRVR